MSETEEWERFKQHRRFGKRMANLNEELAGLAEAYRRADEEIAVEDAELEEAGLQAQAPGDPIAPSDEVIRRPPGRPRWTTERFPAAYREARDRAGTFAIDEKIAKEMDRELVTFRRLVRKFGRPK